MILVCGRGYGSPTIYVMVAQIKTVGASFDSQGVYGLINYTDGSVLETKETAAELAELVKQYKKEHDDRS